jgi:hypothetical protein
MVLNGWFDFLVPDFMTSSSTPTLAPATAPAPADTGPSFWSQIPQMLTAGLNAFSTTQIMSNPAVASSLIRPAGVGPVNPYGIPSGSVLLPGVSPAQTQFPPGTQLDQWGRPIAPSALPSMLPLIMIGGGGLLLIALMMGKR